MELGMVEGIHYASVAIVKGTKTFSSYTRLLLSQSQLLFRLMRKRIETVGIHLDIKSRTYPSSNLSTERMDSVSNRFEVNCSFYAANGVYPAWMAGRELRTRYQFLTL